MPGNERTLAVGLTPRGAALRQQATEVPGTMMARLGLTREQVGQLHASMMDLIAATKAGRRRRRPGGRLGKTEEDC